MSFFGIEVGITKGRKGKKQKAAITIRTKITNIGGKKLKEYFKPTKVLDHKTIARIRAK